MPLTILYAEDHATVRLAVKETLECEGWRVEALADGTAALAKLESGASYALLIFDNRLPGVSGLELARRARLLAHRRSTRSEEHTSELQSRSDLVCRLL